MSARRRLAWIAGVLAAAVSLAAPGALLAADPGEPSLEVGDLAQEAVDSVDQVISGGRDDPEGAETGGSDSSGAAQPAPVAAQATAVAIRDFLFAPRTISVSVGATVTWTNFDDAPHNAEAYDGSFSTPILDKGEAGSVTFDKPGSFEYFCITHPAEEGWPEFTGTVTVAAPDEGGGGGGSDRGSGGATGGETDAGEASGEPVTSPDVDAAGGVAASGAQAGGEAGGPRLPATGLEQLPLVLAGMVLLAAGALLRLRTGDPVG